MKPKWGALGYEPVRGLSERLISRYLRSQRRQLARFFAANGYVDLHARLMEIKYSRQGMMAKNRMFQQVMNEYVARMAPPPKAEASLQPVPAIVGVRDEPQPVADKPVEGGVGVGANDAGGVQPVAGADAQVVIEE